MWWVTAPVIIYGLKKVYDAISDSERNARQNWENKRNEVERSVEEHRANIEKHLSEAQESYNFHFLTDMHFSSMIVANTAYDLLKDARISLEGIGKMIMEAKAQIDSLQNNIGEIQSEIDDEKNKKKKGELIGKIQPLHKDNKLIKDFRKSLFDDQEKVKEQKEHLYSEVKRLNNRTRELKLLIKDRCGTKGKDWYARIERR